MKNIQKFLFFLFLTLFTYCSGDSGSTTTGDDNFNGIWTRIIGASGDETDIAIGNIPGEPDNRVYMCEKEGSATPGLFKGTISGNIITWDKAYNLPDSHLKRIGDNMEFSYPSVSSSIPTMYKKGSWNGYCATLGRAPGIYITYVVEGAEMSSYSDNNPLVLNNMLSGVNYGPCSPGKYNYSALLSNGISYGSSLSYTLSAPAFGFTYRNYQLKFYFSSNLNRWLADLTYFDETLANCNNSTLALTATSNGNSIAANITGGHPPYAYSWNNGATSSAINNLSNGEYNVKITDSEGCQKEASVTVNVSAINAGTVTIGTQQWMKMNLDVDHYRNGDLIPEVQDQTAWANLTTGAWCYNSLTYGKCYNWYAVNDPRGLAPTGYHIPSDTEWTTLTTYLGGEGIAGGKLKEAGVLHWNTPNTGADNSSGFTALPSIYRSSEVGTISGGIKNFGWWWSSTQSSIDNAWYRKLSYDNTIVNRSNAIKKVGLSVRCIKN